MECYFPSFFDDFSVCFQMTPAVCDGARSGIHGITVFILACFIGYYVIWRVTPALHAPLMSVTNAISSVIIIGALMAASGSHCCCSKIFGFVAIMLASVNIFGGFMVTGRMLNMFRKR